MKLRDLAKFYLSLFVSLVFFVNLLTAQELTVRNAHSLVYESATKRILLFGGADEKQVYGDLWELTKDGWQILRTDASPEPRTFASFVYDQKRKCAILFGGNRVLFGSETNPAHLFGDTWEFKNDRWKKLKTKNSPEARAEAGIAYDEQKKRIILFGGYRLYDGKIEKLSDTWELKGNRWKKLNEGNGISPRNGATLAFDPQLKKIILFGGSTADRKYGEQTGETWVLEKDVWKKIDVQTQPANIFNANLVYQKDSQRLFRFGGWNGTARIDETWIFKQNAWEKLQLETSPPPRNHTALIYHEGTQETILFGGHDGEQIYGDLWIFKQGKWSQKFAHPPIKRLDNGH